MARAPTWNDRIAEAQRERVFVIAGERYRRIPYGAERPPWRLPECGDCRVKKGQLHVVGCDIEQCPACSGQLIMCGCLDHEHEDS